MLYSDLWDNLNNYFMLFKIILGESVLIKEIVNLILVLYSFQFNQKHLDFIENRYT